MRLVSPSAWVLSTTPSLRTSAMDSYSRAARIAGPPDASSAQARHAQVVARPAIHGGHHAPNVALRRACVNRGRACVPAPPAACARRSSRVARGCASRVARTRRDGRARRGAACRGSRAAPARARVPTRKRRACSRSAIERDHEIAAHRAGAASARAVVGEAQDVGGAIDAAPAAVQRAQLRVVGEQHGDLAGAAALAARAWR